MALTLEQENALISLLDEPAITLDELPEADKIYESDLLLTQQGLQEKSITIESLKTHFLSLLAEKTERFHLIGSPIAWPTLNVPNGYLKCNGAVFDKKIYPKLAEVYSSGILPDLRGEFIRGCDDGRGVDLIDSYPNSREILTWQEDTMQELYGEIDIMSFGNENAMGVFYEGHSINTLYPMYATNTTTCSVAIDASLYARTSNETRPRNVAFLYIVKAA